MQIGMRGGEVIIGIPVLLVGGTEIQTLNLVNVLVGAGYKVTVCCYYEYGQNMVDRFEAAGAEVLLLKYERAKGLWHLAKGLIGIFREKKPAIVHVQYMAPGFVPVIAAHIAGVKTVFATVHQPGSAYGWRAKMLLRTAARFCTAFFCNSIAVEKSWFGSAALYQPEIAKVRRHCTIYNGVDYAAITKAVSGVNRTALRTQMGVADGPIIGIVGRLSGEKGQAVLLDAMSDVIKTIPDATLLVVGDGPDGEMLRKRAEDLKLSNYVKWLRQKNPEEVYQLYGIMDVVVVPSVFEGFGLVAAEAMAAGRPVVASSADGLREIVDDGVTGILVVPRSSRAIKDAICKLLADRNLSEAMGQLGKERIGNLFSLGRFSSAILDAYRRHSNV
jgi:glycosyltransferase involved in cell wall biosynthesis